eukprot:TRINITY_DN5871_c0_g1_i2.p1 TRINITY_DN5871_c0_g1~~TRINITY_DN5871_c0_g1_i2.p1  ORF type:complete len:176 (+),score=5.22 TRINITY_DN5871_c0_g1_i2:350-877(+)
MDVVPQGSPVIMGGDFNAHIPDLFHIIKDVAKERNSSHVWSSYTATNNTGTDRLRFTSQHEHNFLAAYDGFITRGLADNGTSVVVHEAGFLPKYLRDNGEFGASPFRYSEGPYPNLNGPLLQNHIELSESSYSWSSLSDHCAVSANFQLSSDSSLLPLSVLLIASYCLLLLFSFN